MLIKFADDIKLRNVSPQKTKDLELSIFLSGWNAVMKQKKNTFNSV